MTETEKTVLGAQVADSGAPLGDLRRLKRAKKGADRAKRRLEDMCSSARRFEFSALPKEILEPDLEREE